MDTLQRRSQGGSKQQRHQEENHKISPALISFMDVLLISGNQGDYLLICTCTDARLIAAKPY